MIVRTGGGVAYPSKAVRLAPNSADSHWWLARVEASFGNQRGARKAAAEVARLAPASTLSDRAQGYVALWRWGPRAAERHYRRVLAAEPLDADALLRLARLVALRHPSRAVSMLSAGLAANPTSAALLAGLRRCALGWLRRHLTLLSLFWGAIVAGIGPAIRW